ncbi:hypothetical protein OQA88_7219 [Cercophora sp. LCS_1]
MLSLKCLLLTATTALAIPFPSSDNLPLSKRSAAVGNGSHGGFFYNFWSDGLGDVNYNNGADGSYSVRWTNCSNFFGGKGWNPGREDRNITFDATFSPKGNGYLSVYGWTKDPLVEYYVVENWGTYNPALQFGSAAKTIEVDGGRYTIGLRRVVQMALGSPVLTQMWSVRHAEDRRVSGTVALKSHFEAWKGLPGAKFGALDWQIVATEGYQSSGEAAVTVYD